MCILILLVSPLHACDVSNGAAQAVKNELAQTSVVEPVENTNKSVAALKPMAVKLAVEQNIVVQKTDVQKDATKKGTEKEKAGQSKVGQSKSIAAPAESKVQQSDASADKIESVGLDVYVDAINIEMLTQRLKKTHAIGLFTKLAIRNDITDLKDEIIQYRQQSMLKEKMREIRSSFDGLLLKIMALLEEDPDLSRDLYVGRELIWKSLLEVKA